MLGCLHSRALNVHPVFPELPAGLGGDLGESRASRTVEEAKNGSKICSASQDFNL